MFDYNTAYELVTKLQEILEQDHDDQILNRPDFRKIQALAATYTLQEYLSNIIAELENTGVLDHENEGSDVFDERPEEEAYWKDLMMEIAQMEGEEMLAENERLKNDPSFIVPEHITQRNLEAIRKAFDRRNNPERIRPFLMEIASIWENHPSLRFGELIVKSVSGQRELYFMEENTFLSELQSRFPD